MLINFFLGNVPTERLKKLLDLLRPLRHGLVEAGHQVIGYGLALVRAPAVNLLVEHFPDESFVERLLAMKAEAGLVFGVVCAEDVQALAAAEPARAANLRRVATAADFVWTTLPQIADVEALAGPGRVAFLEFGFSERLVNRKLIAQQGLRDLDIVIEGQETPRRRAILDELGRRGLKCFISGARLLPAFATADLARRAKIYLDVRRAEASRFASPVRIAKGLHNGALVLSERPAVGAGSGVLDQFIIACDPGTLVDRCVATVKSGMTANLGLAALADFRTKTSMRENIRRAMALPAFTRLG